jgi:hypothetical protein
MYEVDRSPGSRTREPVNNSTLTRRSVGSASLTASGENNNQLANICQGKNAKSSKFG